MKREGELDGIVLGVLQTAPAHGYEIAKRIRLLSSGVLSVGEAKIYPCLHKLEENGCVVAEWVPQEGKPARKVYSLTARGRGLLEEKKASWSEFVTGMSALLGVKEVPRA